MAKRWLDALGSERLAGRVEIAGFVDIDLAAAEQLRAEAGLNHAAIGSDLAAVLDQCKPDLLFDVVIPDARRDVVAAGLARGCHVLSEKPMAGSMMHAEELVGLARQAGRIHAVMQNRRYVPGIRRIRRFVESGLLGELTALHADFFIGAHFGGFRDSMRHALLLDMAIHTFDAARFIASKDAQHVYCQETNPRGSWYAHGAAANAIFDLADSVVFTYRGSWAAEGAHTSWEGSWRIVGTHGTLLWDGADQFEAHVVAGDEGFHRPLVPVEVPAPTDPTQIDGHTSVIAEFVRSVETDGIPETVGVDNLKSLAMVFAAVESARAGLRVAISQGVR